MNEWMCYGKLCLVIKLCVWENLQEVLHAPAQSLRCSVLSLTLPV